MIPEIASWMLGSVLAAPFHMVTGFTVTALSEGTKHLSKQLDSEEVKEMEPTNAGVGHTNPLDAMMGECLDMALGLYGISRSIHIGSGPSLTEAQDCELRDIEARLERLMGVHRWPCRWHRPCSS